MDAWVSIRLSVRGIPMRAFKLMRQIVHWKGLQGLTTYLLRVFLRALTSSRASNRSYTLITSGGKVPYPFCLVHPTMPWALASAIDCDTKVPCW